MPHFGFTSFWSWLAYRVGSLARVGVTGILAEFRHITQRTRISSRVEKSAWMVRSVTSCVLVGAEGWLCLYLLPLGIVQTAIASTISWAVLFILPKPTPRLPLFGARLIIAGTTSGLLQRAVELVLNDGGPRATEWKFPLLAVWFLIVIVLF